MSAIEAIRKIISKEVLDSGIISRSLMCLPASGASEDAIAQCERSMPRKLSASHKKLLKIWNGLDLDVVRVHGVEPVDLGIRGLTEYQEILAAELQRRGAIAFASDPSGFLYLENSDGSVYSLDSDGGQLAKVAESVDEFFATFVFGKKAADFAGDDWYADLKRIGLV